MSTSPPVQLYGPLYGSFFFGTILSTTFYGVTCMQTFFYYVHYPNDHLRMKIFVAVVWVLNTIHEALNLSGVYKYIITGLVHPWSYSFLEANPEIILQILLTILVTIPTRGFFVYRIYIFSGKSFAAPVIWVLLAVIQFSTAIMYIGKALYSANGLQAVELTVLSESSFMILATICLSVGAAVDILIAIFLTFLLLYKRTSNGIPSSTTTGHIMQRLTVFAVNTGTWPATFALLTVILLHVFPSNMLYVIPYIPLCSVYCNTLLANLNARGYIGGEVTATTRNIGTDLVTDLSVRVRDSNPKPDRQYERQELDFAPQEGIWMTTDTLTFSDDVNRFSDNTV